MQPKIHGITFLFLILLLGGVSAQDQVPEPYRITSLLIPLTQHADIARMTKARVVDIVDGDTIKIEIEAPPAGLACKETVRLIGVDTPETVDPRKEVERFGLESSAYAKERLLGKQVLLAFDKDLRDVYGRLLAYIFLENGSCFDLELIEEGYGFAYVKYPFFFMDEFRNAELGARYGHKGMWGE